LSAAGGLGRRLPILQPRDGYRVKVERNSNSIDISAAPM
jgi:hypothetical protein